MIGEKTEYDISSNWYIIGRDMNKEYITIDLNPLRLGRCYDSYWENHGVPGNCAIIATTFTELITLGDAYDE